MLNPVYKIETWTGAVLDHTLTDNVASIHVKEVLTDNVGIFSFALPLKVGSAYPYNDIAVKDKVKIYLGYNSISASDLQTVGSIYNIASLGDSKTGYVRVFTGRNQGEILQRRFKTKRWEAVEASTIVNELATDLSLGTGDIQATSGKSITMQVDDRKYWDIMRELSDYWITGGAELSRDFYVDTDNDLVWKDRPLRSAGVETLTVGDNISSYNVSRDMTQTFNKITVYGAREKPTQSDKDAYCEATSNGHTWSAPEGGSLSTDADSYLGSWSIEITENATSVLVASCALEAVKSALYDPEFKNLHFSLKVPAGAAGNVGTVSIRIREAITSNYFATILTPSHHGLTIGGNWKTFSIPIGKGREVSGTGYNGEWYLAGTPNWDDINSVMFRIAFTSSDDHTALIDAMYLGEARYSDVAEDSTSQTNYGIREMMVIDDNLRADSECEQMSEALIDIYKDPQVQIEVTTPLNTNILIGDRLSMTIPAEGISAANYDVFQVDHFCTRDAGAFTMATMNSAAKHRRKVPTNQRDLTRKMWKLAKEAWMVRRVVA